MLRVACALALLLGSAPAAAQQTFFGVAKLTTACGSVLKQRVGFTLHILPAEFDTPNLRGVGTLILFGVQAPGVWARAPYARFTKSVQAFTAVSGDSVYQVTGILSVRTTSATLNGSIVVHDLATGCVHTGKAHALWRQ
jgi:hypothetical protein